MFRSGTELVLVNVVVRDKSGAVVRGLTRDDFIVTEDDKPQTITSFDFEELDKVDAPARPADGSLRRRRCDPAAEAGRPSRRTALAPGRRSGRKSTCAAGG